MHRSSKSIGKIAAALARAQQTIENPEKNLRATMASPFPHEGSVSFRYASLANGLEIVRKALGEHEIATIQSTEIDKELGLIRLNTVLAHSSGEWISSDWPVCSTSEVAAPHRLGAALTYARRYALFALVGIAGEDDLDAPDLPIQPAHEPGHPTAPGQGPLARTTPRGKLHSVPLSEETRRKLLAELNAIDQADDLTLWALRRLPLKNQLQDKDARLVEAAYLAKLNGLDGSRANNQVSAETIRAPIDGGRAAPNTAVVATAQSERDQQPSAGAPTPQQRADSDPANTSANLTEGRQTGTDTATPKVTQEGSPANVAPDAVTNDSTVIQLPKIPRLRSKAHLAFVASQPCIVCQSKPADAHHLRFAQPRAMGRKVSDEFTVPLCRSHHRELHAIGNEQSWWANVGIAPLVKAEELWRNSRDLQAMSERPQRSEPWL